jgi:alpha-L-arabinofuranosidase
MLKNILNTSDEYIDAKIYGRIIEQYGYGCYYIVSNESKHVGSYGIRMDVYGVYAYFDGFCYIRYNLME